MADGTYQEFLVLSLPTGWNSLIDMPNDAGYEFTIAYQGNTDANNNFDTTSTSTFYEMEYTVVVAPSPTLPDREGTDWNVSDGTFRSWLYEYYYKWFFNNEAFRFCF